MLHCSRSATVAHEDAREALAAKKSARQLTFSLQGLQRSAIWMASHGRKMVFLHARPEVPVYS